MSFVDRCAALRTPVQRGKTEKLDRTSSVNFMLHLIATRTLMLFIDHVGGIVKVQHGIWIDDSQERDLSQKVNKLESRLGQGSSDCEGTCPHFR